MTISNIHGSGGSLGEITGHDKATIKDIILKNADLQLSNPEFKVGNVQNLRFENVKVNGKEVQAPLMATKS